MKNIILIFAILLAATLAACSGGAEVTEVVVPDTPVPPAAEAAEPEATSEPVEVGENTVPLPMTSLDNGCTLTSSGPEASAELVELFGVTENDWVKGPETAALTIVEYGDFQ